MGYRRLEKNLVCINNLKKNLDVLYGKEFGIKKIEKEFECAI